MMPILSAHGDMVLLKGQLGQVIKIAFAWLTIWRFGESHYITCQTQQKEQRTLP